MKINLELIRERRLKMGYSQEYIAGVLNISQAKYSRLESGATVFDTTRLGKLIHILELDPLQVIILTETLQKISIHQNDPEDKPDIETIRKIVKEEISRLR
ncbi:helix-turn-helix domain-containing protein [Elizabethkingia meningoseptica]|uniref:helix-turn-helix domain-containing protein n=1 Tax=Elizabethkingia meningoseptica TaxID=238 RepID=UPI0023B1FA11|nr:helix-turn-helix transcriptional regulator [Elizabethkingia meningoseptica]MDE5493655.1 helix-turn-helix domain-containing protein [Elizabethkingia meningoseptica]